MICFNRYVHAVVVALILSASAAYSQEVKPTEVLPRDEMIVAVPAPLPFVGEHVGLVGATLGQPRAPLGAIDDADFAGAANVLISIFAQAEASPTLALEPKRHAELWDNYLVEAMRDRSVDRVGLHVATQRAPTLLN